MKYLLSCVLGTLVLLSPQITGAQEVSLIAPGGMRCALDRMKPDFESKIGHAVKITIGPGGATHQQVVRGELFDVPVVQVPYSDVIASGNVVATSETPLATVAVVVVVREGDPKPDISTPSAVKQMLLAAKAISYPDGANGAGGTAGVSFDNTQKKLGIYNQLKPKIKRVQGRTLSQMLVNRDIDVGVTYASELREPGVEVVGPLPKEISAPTSLVGFISSHARSPESAKSLLKYLSSPDAAVAYKACAMQPAR